MKAGEKVEDKDIHIGDVLYIKEWDEMLRDGQLTIDGDIEFTLCSTKQTKTISFRHIDKHRCGSQFTVKKRHKRSFGILYESKEDNRRGAFAVWLTPKEPCFETASDDEIRLLLS